MTAELFANLVNKKMVSSEESSYLQRMIVSHKGLISGETAAQPKPKSKEERASVQNDLIN